MQFGRGGKPSAGAFFDSAFTTLDSYLALALLHGLQGKNDCRVAIVTTSRPNLAVVGLLDTVERFYRGPAGNFAQVPPVGMHTEGAAGETPAAVTAPFEKKKADGTPVWKNQVRTVIETGDPNTLIRNYLEAQYDQNSFFILAGPATNLAAALEFRGMKELIAAKSKYLVFAGGSFAGGSPEANVKADVAAARKVLAEWPNPVIAAGAEVGDAFEFPGAVVDKDWAANVADHPVAEMYKAWKPNRENTRAGVMAATLYAARPKENYFKVSEPGTITVRDDGTTSFAPSAGGRHQHLIVDPDSKDKVTQALVELTIAKPVLPQRFRPPVAAVEEKKP